jgi:hypothetical protein
MSNAGFTRPAVKCEKCGVPFSLTLGVRDMKSVKELPDPFLAKCPACGHQANYPKPAIQILVGVGPR